MFSEQRYDSYMLIFIPIVIVSCMVTDTWINKVFGARFWVKCGAISFEMFLLHAPIIYIYQPYSVI